VTSTAANSLADFMPVAYTYSARLATTNWAALKHFDAIQARLC
jgi:hypothetical protein